MIVRSTLKLIYLLIILRSIAFNCVQLRLCALYVESNTWMEYEVERKSAARAKTTTPTIKWAKLPYEMEFLMAGQQSQCDTNCMCSAHTGCSEEAQKQEEASINMNYDIAMSPCPFINYFVQWTSKVIFPYRNRTQPLIHSLTHKNLVRLGWSKKPHRESQQKAYK